MKFSRLQYIAIGVTVVSALLAGAAVAVASPRQGGPFTPAKTVGKPIATVDQGKVARAARREAREKAGNISWAAFTAARLEPRSALKGIKMTSSAKSATHFIQEGYLDRFEELDKADKNAYYTVADTSTIMTDIAAMRLKQRAALRATLTREQRILFDSNVVALVAKEGAV